MSPSMGLPLPAPDCLPHRAQMRVQETAQCRGREKLPHHPYSNTNTRRATLFPPLTPTQRRCALSEGANDSYFQVSVGPPGRVCEQTLGFFSTTAVVASQLSLSKASDNSSKSCRIVSASRAYQERLWPFNWSEFQWFPWATHNQHCISYNMYNRKCP